MAQVSLRPGQARPGQPQARPLRGRLTWEFATRRHPGHARRRAVGSESPVQLFWGSGCHLDPEQRRDFKCPARWGTRTGHRRRLVAESSQSTVALTSCQWGPAIDASIQTRKPPFPVPPIPHLAGNRGGNPRFPIRPGPGNREPPFPDSAGNGNRGPDWPQIGKSGIPLSVCEYIMHDPGLDVTLSP